MSRQDERFSGGSRLWSEAPKEQADKALTPPINFGVRHSRHYKAFELRANVGRLHIHAATQPSRFPSYHYLLDIVFDHDFQSTFTLIYSFMAVEVKGKNLGEVVSAISYGSCASIQEFHRKFHDPVSHGEAVIEAITITVPGNDQDSD